MEDSEKFLQALRRNVPSQSIKENTLDGSYQWTLSSQNLNAGFPGVPSQSIGGNTAEGNYQSIVKLENLDSGSQNSYFESNVDPGAKPEYYKYLKKVSIKEEAPLSDSFIQEDESKVLGEQVKTMDETIEKVTTDFRANTRKRKPDQLKKIESNVDIDNGMIFLFKARPATAGPQGTPPANQPVFTTNQAQAQSRVAASSQAQQGINSQNLRQFPNLAVPQMIQASLSSQFQQQQDTNADGSATNKALSQMEVDEEGKKKWKKGTKLPLAIRKKRMNHRLSKILTPKNALILLHEFRPGCTYKVLEQPGTNPPIFLAHVEHNNTILASGQGMSKSQAKNAAAENAIKAIVSQTMTQKVAEAAQAQAASTDPFATTDVKMEEDDETKDPAANLPWAGLASFAIYKMFTEWQNQGTDVPMTRSTPAKSKKKSPAKTPTVKKDLPPNAKDLHPSVLLNTMRPGIVAVEISRTSTPTTSVTMGYEVDGRMITGTAGNKKDAKREAAKAVITALYGLQYPS